MLSVEEVRAAVLRKAALDPDAPSDLLDELDVGRIALCGLPTYSISTNWSSSVTASVGYFRTETYTAYREVYRNGHSYREPYTAYRTVTDWRPWSGNYSGEVYRRVIGCNASPLEIAAAQSFATHDTARFQADFGVEPRALSKSEREAVHEIESSVDAQIRKTVKEKIPGDVNKDVVIGVSKSETVLLKVVPVYSFDLSYKDAVIPVVASAVDAKSLLVDFPKSEELQALRKRRPVIWGIFAICCAALAATAQIPVDLLGPLYNFTGYPIYIGAYIAAFAMIAYLTLSADLSLTAAQQKHVRQSLQNRQAALEKLQLGSHSPIEVDVIVGQAVKRRPLLLISSVCITGFIIFGAAETSTRRLEVSQEAKLAPVGVDISRSGVTEAQPSNPSSSLPETVHVDDGEVAQNGSDLGSGQEGVSVDVAPIPDAPIAAESADSAPFAEQKAADLNPLLQQTWSNEKADNLDVSALKAWKVAQELDTVAAYERFMSMFPTSVYSIRAQDRINQIKNDEVRRSWEDAEASNTRDAIEQFLRTHPGSRFGPAAAQRLRQLVERDCRAYADASLPASSDGSGDVLVGVLQGAISGQAERAIEGAQSAIRGAEDRRRQGQERRNTEYRACIAAGGPP